MIEQKQRDLKELQLNINKHQNLRDEKQIEVQEL